MTKGATIKNKGSIFFDDDSELLALIPLHKWLLISASVLIFVILPLLFIWSSMGIIHPHRYEPSHLFADGRLDGAPTHQSSIKHHYNQLG